MRVKILRSLEEKVKGLTGVEDIYPVYFETYGVIHTFGMLVSIDVAILDKEKRVRKLARNLLPNRLFFWNPMYSGVLELPSETITKEGLRVGEKIVFEEK